MPTLSADATHFAEDLMLAVGLFLNVLAGLGSFRAVHVRCTDFWQFTGRHGRFHDIDIALGTAALPYVICSNDTVGSQHSTDVTPRPPDQVLQA